LLSILAVFIVGIQAQRGGKGGKGGKGAADASTSDMSVDTYNEQGIQLNQSVPFNQTDKTQYSRREWMAIAITQFFDDFENGITSNAPYIFAPGCPYISNGAIYAGLDMSQPSTWAVIPPKRRIEREISALNGTETWARCIGVYPDGHQAIEFTAFTFDRQGLISSMSKLENKECAASGASSTSSAPAAAGQVSTPANAATVTSTSSSSNQTTVLTPPVALGLRADTKRVRDTSMMASAAPTSAPTSSPTAAARTATGKGKNGKGGKM